jgi:DNA-binding GntR family transcriptional regulator
MEQPITTLSEATLKRSLADMIEEEIVLGWLQPRERLVEEELAARYRVKRHVVRDALFALERIGLVERVPNKGAVVRMLRAVDVEQIYSVRDALEALAAQQIPLPAAPALIDQLEAIQERHSAAVAAADPRAAFRANMAFHHALFGSCGNPHLAEVIHAFEQKAHGVRSYTAADPVHLARARDEHLAIIAALRCGDRDGLVALCRKHLVPSNAAYIAALKRRGLE